MSRLDPNRPTVPQVLPLVKKVYERHAAGCCLHVVLDDCNYEREFAEFCLEYAKEQKHPECIELAEKLVQMSNTQRSKLARIH